jgi:hypothetical protein
MKALMLFLVLGVQVVSAADLVCGDLGGQGISIYYTGHQKVDDYIFVSYFGFKNEENQISKKLASFHGKKNAFAIGGLFSQVTYDLTGVDDESNEVTGELTLFTSSFIGRGGDEIVRKSVNLIYADQEIKLFCH